MNSVVLHEFDFGLNKLLNRIDIHAGREKNLRFYCPIFCYDYPVVLAVHLELHVLDNNRSWHNTRMSRSSWDQTTWVISYGDLNG